MPDEEDLTVVTNQDSMHSLAGLPSRYEIRGLLGQGGMGMVFRAFDKHLGRELAIKVLLFAGAADAGVHERFLREARALAVLDHPNIVKVLSWGLTEKGNPYTVMELLEGSSLAAELSSSGKFSPDKFKEIFLQVLSGLSHAHSQNFVHRDIKPSNIFLCKQNDGTILAKIIDFGLARLEGGSTSALTQTNTLIGSPAYMSPEQCRGSAVDRLSDIYSLACVMHEVLTGMPPHQAETAMELMYKHANEDTAKLSRLALDPASRRLAELIDRSLSRNPALRPQSAEQVKRELEEIFQSKFDTSSFFVNLENRKRKYGTLLIVLVSSVLLLAPLGLSFLFRADKENVYQKNSDPGRLAGELSTIEEEILGLERSYVSAKTQEAKTEQAERIVRKLLEKGRRQTLLRDYPQLEKTLNKAMSYCPETDRSSQDLRARVNLNYGLCKVAMHDDTSAETYFDNGVACLLIQEGELNTRAALLKQRALLHIRNKQYAKLRVDLQILTDDCPSYCPAIFRELCKALSQANPPEPEDKVLLLRAYHHIAFFLCRRNSPDVLEAALCGLKRMLKSIPSKLMEKNRDLQVGIDYVFKQTRK